MQCRNGNYGGKTLYNIKMCVLESKFVNLAIIIIIDYMVQNVHSGAVVFTPYIMITWDVSSERYALQFSLQFKMYPKKTLDT
ncbi:hypothetical protein GDO86_000208 [Hymenochirus boettgeri]|uniref:Uncharacterized protein n=1 Tax=Hymenochirus boettgeri TaxID=247094 RepID=A0A8T2K8G3_9PIPI|nr:hypothetical protein GDO86_000208 [Hymenochirus boettgeri]